MKILIILLALLFFVVCKNKGKVEDPLIKNDFKYINQIIGLEIESTEFDYYVKKYNLEKKILKNDIWYLSKTSGITVNIEDNQVLNISVNLLSDGDEQAFDRNKIPLNIIGVKNKKDLILKLGEPSLERRTNIGVFKVYRSPNYGYVFFANTNNEIESVTISKKK